MPKSCVPSHPKPVVSWVVEQVVSLLPAEIHWCPLAPCESLLASGCSAMAQAKWHLSPRLVVWERLWMVCQSHWLPWAIAAWSFPLVTTSMRRPGTPAIGAMSTWVASNLARNQRTLVLLLFFFWLLLVVVVDSSIWAPSIGVLACSKLASPRNGGSLDIRMVLQGMWFTAQVRVCALLPHLQAEGGLCFFGSSHLPGACVWPDWLQALWRLEASKLWENPQEVIENYRIRRGCRPYRANWCSHVGHPHKALRLYF